MGIEIDISVYKSIKEIRKKNIFYKREFLECIYQAAIDDGLDDLFLSLDSMDYPKKHKRELVVDTFWFSQLVVLVDFLNPIQISFKMANGLIEYDLLLENIKYSDNPDEELFSNFTNLNPKSFDWEIAESNNYKFIVSL